MVAGRTETRETRRAPRVRGSSPEETGPDLLAVALACAVAVGVAGSGVGATVHVAVSRALAALHVPGVAVTRRARSRAVARSVQVLLLRLVRLLAGGGGRGCRRRGRGAALGRRPAAGAHRVAMGHVRGDGRRGDVDGVLTAVTGPVADVHLLLTV